MNPAVPQVTHSPAHSVDSAGELFSAKGILAQKTKDFEFRPEQQKMAEAVAEALDSGKILVVEAGTGTGKTWAYLVPVLLWAQENKKRVVISTYTKNLQHQLLSHDLPVIEKALGIDVPVELFKGKENYLCLLRLNRHADETTLFKEKGKFSGVFSWAEKTKTGDLSEYGTNGEPLSTNLRNEVNVENHFCLHQECLYYSPCFYFKARRRAQEAAVVIVNHFLFFADLVTDHSLLGHYDAVVFDEAHRVEEVASRYFGAESDYWTIRRTCERLYNERPNPSGLLTIISTRINAVLHAKADKNWWQKNLSLAQEKVQGVAQAAFDFFTEAAREVPRENADDSFPIKRRLKSDDDFLRALRHPAEGLGSTLSGLAQQLGKLSNSMQEIDPEVLPEVKEYAFELDTRAKELTLTRNTLLELLSAEEDDQVFWVELLPKNPLSVAFHRVPLDIKEELKAKIYDQVEAAVFSSATLAVNGDFGYTCERLGLAALKSGRVNCKQFGSSFPLADQMKVFVADFVGSPLEGEYLNAISNLLSLSCRKVPAKTLALFTSHSHLERVHRSLRAELDEAGVDLFGQVIDGTAEEVLERFRKARRALLLGVAALWEGIDLPGRQLELIYICRLPFAVPTDPVAQARMEKLEQEGLDPFTNYSLPEAVLRFKQGLGRLIRTRNDRGAVVVLDNRILRKGYGRFFAQALPVELEAVKTEGELFERLAGWLR